MSARETTRPMKTLTTLLAGLALAAAGCGPSAQCPEIASIDDALASTCGLGPAPTPDAGATACTPAPGTICTVVGTGEAGFGDDNLPGPRTRIYLPQDVVVAPDGRAVYFLDWNNHIIRALLPSGIVRKVVGKGELTDDDTPEGPVMGTQPALDVRLNHPTHMTFDAQGRMLIAAWHNSKIKRVLNLDPERPTQAVVEDLCGTGARSFRGDGGPAIMAALDLPVAVAISPAGETYIADQANQRIRRVDGAGMITTVVGTGTRGYAGDEGPAAMAQLNNPVGQAAAPAGRITFDARGNLYIADTGNNRVRRVTPAGMITTVVGTGAAGAAGDGRAATDAQLSGPTDVEVGPDGTLYIADTQNSCVRSVGADGVIQTVAGRCGTRGFEGDGASPRAALLDRPYGVAVHGNNLYIADTYNQRVRVVVLR